MENFIFCAAKDRSRNLRALSSICSYAWFSLKWKVRLKKIVPFFLSSFHCSLKHFSTEFTTKNNNSLIIKDIYYNIICNTFGVILFSPVAQLNVAVNVKIFQFIKSFPSDITSAHRRLIPKEIKSVICHRPIKRFQRTQQSILKKFITHTRVFSVKAFSKTSQTCE